MRRAAVALLGLMLALPAGAAADTIDVPSAAHLTIVGHSPGPMDMSGAGDVNGDGVADLVVIDAVAGPQPGDSPTESAYVVFGRRTPGTVDLAALGDEGFHISGAVHSVAPAGDVNDDGLADVILAQPRADFNARAGAGVAYVVFGKASTATVDLAALGGGGFRIGGPRALSTLGNPFPFVDVDGAGDVNGDGRADVIVGFAEVQCVGSVPSCEDFAGSAFVVFGKAGSTTVDTAALGSAGFSIEGGLAGSSVAGLGDFNGDGVPDVAVSRRSDNAGWVVFGRRPGANVDLANLGANGFSFVDSTKTDVGGGQMLPLGSVAWSLAGPGDVNGDGRRDLLVGVGTFTELSGFDQRAAVIFGGSATAPVDIASLGTRGFQMSVGDNLGLVDAAGDANGDGRGDLLLHGRLESNEDAGVLLVFGKSSSTPVDVRHLGTEGVNLDAPFTIGKRGFGSAGDMTGDGVADVAVSVPNGAGAGHAYVVSLKPSAQRRLDEIRFAVASFGLPTRLRDRFFARLDGAGRAILNGRQPAACRRIDRLIALAQRLNGTRLTGAHAFTIVAGGGRARNALGCG